MHPRPTEAEQWLMRNMVVEQDRWGQDRDHAVLVEFIKYRVT